MDNSAIFGTLISEHDENQKANVTNLLIGLVCLGMTVPMAIFFSKEESITFNKILFGAIAIFLVIGGAVCVMSYFKNRKGRVKIYENGLTVEKGGKFHQARWDEIASLYESVEKMHMNGQYIYDRYNYTIIKTNGEKFELSNLISNIDEIGRQLKTKTFEQFYPRIAAKIDGGETYHFGQVAVDKNSFAGTPWTSLASVRLHDGMLEVKDKNGNAVIKGTYAGTPNAHLLLAVLRERLPLES